MTLIFLHFLNIDIFDISLKPLSLYYNKNTVFFILCLQDGRLGPEWETEKISERKVTVVVGLVFEH